MIGQQDGRPTADWLPRALTGNASDLCGGGDALRNVLQADGAALHRQAVAAAAAGASEGEGGRGQQWKEEEEQSETDEEDGREHAEVRCAGGAHGKPRNGHLTLETQKHKRQTNA